MHIKSGMIKFNVCKWKKKKEVIWTYTDLVD